MGVIMKRYNPTEIEPKWQKIWADDRRYEAKDFDERQKFYISCMFPYPSAAGMHTGHSMEHAIVDGTARFQLLRDRLGRDAYNRQPLLLCVQRSFNRHGVDACVGRDDDRVALLQGCLAQDLRSLAGFAFHLCAGYRAGVEHQLIR